MTNQPKLGALLIGLTAVLAVAASLYLWVRGAAQPTPPPTVASTGSVEYRRPVEPLVSLPKKAPPPLDYRRKLADSSNYWDLAHEILPSAKAGDRDAQFFLSRVLERCAMDNKMFFRRRGQTLTLDAALQWAAERKLSIDVVQSTYDHCHEFLEGDASKFGDPTEWLAGATDAGQPLAQATTASKLLMKNSMVLGAASAGVATEQLSLPQVKSEADPRDLLRAAVASRDPEVLFTIGELQGLLNPANMNDTTDQYAWWLVACQRGFDCSANGEWMRNCANLDADCASAGGPSEAVQRFAGDQWPEVQQRASEISEKLDAGRWSDLGLGR
jgi:hypothetical protein